MNVVVFDFDGVIIPSEGIKRQGYSLMFSEYGESVPEREVFEAIEEFSNAKGDRYDIIRSILLRVGVRGDIDQKVTEYAERFNRIVREKIETFTVSSADRSRLQSLSKSSRLYINSNTPDAPLQESIHRLDIGGLFQGIYGSSVSKADTLRVIAKREGVEVASLVFVGDGDGDREAAAECKCVFIGIATPTNGWSSDNVKYPVVQSISEITDDQLLRVL